MGEPAGLGPDAATGAGLVNARGAWLRTMGRVANQFLGAVPAQQAQMVVTGQMPRNVSQFADLLRTIGSGG
jgi:serine protease AprX